MIAAATSCFGKVEAKQNPSVPETICTTTEDLATLETTVDSMVAGVVGTLEGSPPTTCGDGVAEGAESCDGADLGGATCGSLGYSSGTLSVKRGATSDFGDYINQPRRRGRQCGLSTARRR